MPAGWHVCSTPGCPRLVSKHEPCPDHGRPRNARWSTDRDGAEHMRFARQVKARDGYRCQMCGTTTDLHAHHVSATSGITLCRSCHRSVDKHAR